MLSRFKTINCYSEESKHSKNS